MLYNISYLGPESIVQYRDGHKSGFLARPFAEPWYKLYTSNVNPGLFFSGRLGLKFSQAGQFLSEIF